ncbi:hypothetical protein WJX73_000276 [Symbiochloris irregularis]|uniref:Uncharacterized protein n=1 Tax=Symbiochloris irregularis TaxID=706552 RepID=A0AAW1P2V9_9CHLO
MLSVLQCSCVVYSEAMVRDTAAFPSLMGKIGDTLWRLKLRDLTLDLLSRILQRGHHSPVDDARAALLLYQLWWQVWEEAIRLHQVEGVQAQQG